jgi:uncharacterized membrane protein YdjX (TVP38/TMEM64 family)/rhodanese-related sulfurtransferase
MRTNIARLALIITITTGIALVAINSEAFSAVDLADWVKTAGAMGPILFVFIYAVGTVFFLPGSVFTLAGGALFGPLSGTLYSLTGATIGATLAFLTARYLASGWVEQRVGGRLKRLKEGVEGEGWRFIAFVRLVPFFPFNLLNYALGLTRIKTSIYIVTSYVCMLPGALAYSYLGYAGREAVNDGENMIEKGLLALALLAVAAFLPRLIRRFRQKAVMSIPALKQGLDSGEDILVLDVRGADEFVGEQGHISRANNIPLDQLPNRLTELADYQERPIVIVCRTDRRSRQAAQLLVQEGFADVQVARGGMTEWNTKDFPVER